MRKTLISLLVTVLFLPVSTKAQPESNKYLLDKPGKWSSSSNINGDGAQYTAMAKNAALVAEWFHQNSPMLTNSKGFDLSAVLFGFWDEQYKKRACNYGVRGQLRFDIQLFLSAGGKWTVEPPSYSLYINSTVTGHGTNTHYIGFDNTKDDPSLEGPMEKVSGEINDLFPVFPLINEIAPGVRLYGDGHLIVFNPDRPPFWVPVTLREYSQMILNYYTVFKDKEMGQMLLDELNKEIAELTAEEFDAPAFLGDENHFALNANGKQQGLQLMRFNKEYWDRSLPASAIQFITLWDPLMTEAEMDEYFQNNGHPHYGQLLISSLKLNELAALIKRKE